MKCLNSSTTDISKHYKEHLQNGTGGSDEDERMKEREQCAHTAKTQSSTLLYKTSVYSHVLYGAK